jgi:hypothetical protein
VLGGGGATAQGGTVNTTITGNTIAEPGNTAGTIIVLKQGVHFGTVRGDTYTACAAITGNPLAASGADGVWRWRRRISTLMPVYTGSATDTSESRAS